MRGVLGASRPAPLARTVRARLVRVRTAPPGGRRVHLPYISPASVLYLPCISPVSPPYLPCISPASPQAGDEYIFHARPRDQRYGGGGGVPSVSCVTHDSFVRSFVPSTVRGTYGTPVTGTRTQYVQRVPPWGVGRPAPRVLRAVRGRPVRVACTYPTEAPGRACQLRAEPACAPRSATRWGRHRASHRPRLPPLK